MSAKVTERNQQKIANFQPDWKRSDSTFNL